MELFNVLIVYPLTNILVALYQVLTAAGVPYALGFSIILLTVIIKLLLYPFTASQMKMTKKMQEIAPHVSDLKEKHKNDPKKLQQETMQLYAAHGVNPLAGCLPMILQMIILFGLYSVLNEVSKDPQSVLSHINSILYHGSLKLTSVWDTSFFGLPLVKKPSELMTTLGPVILLIPFLTGFLQFIQSAMMFTAPTKAPAKKKASNDSSADMASSMQSSMLYVLPIFIGYISFTLPLALALYWNTFTIFGIIQQYKTGGLGRIAEWKARFLPSSAN